MKINNQINSPTNSLGWTAFTTVITAGTISPTFGAGSVQKSYYLQQGKTLFIKFFFQGISAGSSNGSGSYIFSIPSNFSMNTSIVAFTNNTYNLGCASAYNTSGDIKGTGTPIAYDSTHYTILLFSASTALGNNISNTWFQATTGPYYSSSLEIPIN